MKRTALYFLLFCFSFQISLAQTRSGNEYALAMQYYEQREYEKANIYFEDLFEKNQHGIFPYYYQSLFALKDFSKAEKITKKFLKANPYNVYLYVYLARIYKAEENPKKEKEAYEKAIKEVPSIQQYAQMLANAFAEDGLYDYSLNVYDKVKTKDYPYFYEKAEVYKQKGDLVSMINQYLDALEFRETEILMVQTHLQNSLGYDDDEGGMKNPILKQELQKRLQKNPDKLILAELLVFILKQQKDFDGAFVQLKALDKKQNEEGSRIYDLARICTANEAWDAAYRCYEYIIQKGPNNLFYDGARVDILHVEYKALTAIAQPKKEDLLALENKLIKAQEIYEKTHLNAFIVKTLANLQAYYLNKADQAIEILETLITQPGLEAVAKAEYKMLQADIYVIIGQIWDASLLYSQVEKDFKYEAIGQECKFRNAKLSFYAGDFEWAKKQADILKGATSKLIANDALDLSLIITDAIGVDTNAVPLQIFALSELMVLQHNFDAALLALDSINKTFSTHTLGDDIYFKKAQIFKSIGKYTEAESMYKNILEYFPNELYGDDAQFKLAELYERNLLDQEKAKLAYQDVLTKYPGSIYVVESRKRYRDLRGDAIKN
ncbi:MAG: tetratricopeptide repeat protein [Sphingobacteriaceae bacterium]|nr:tetratricopeptide repeat protein [Sphingobacteriaceae bacterium]